MTKDEITSWALANGWAMMDGFPSLTKPSAPHPAIVRLVLKATVASVETKKPAGKWLFQDRTRPRNRHARRAGAGHHFRADPTDGKQQRPANDGAHGRHEGLKRPLAIFFGGEG
jgi:hypothetical protein